MAIQMGRFRNQKIDHQTDMEGIEMLRKYMVTDNYSFTIIKLMTRKIAGRMRDNGYIVTLA